MKGNPILKPRIAIFKVSLHVFISLDTPPKFKQHWSQDLLQKIKPLRTSNTTRERSSNFLCMVQTAERHQQKLNRKRETNRLLAETEPKIHADKQNTKGFGFSLTLGPLKRNFPKLSKNRHKTPQRATAPWKKTWVWTTTWRYLPGMIKGKTYVGRMYVL